MKFSVKEYSSLHSAGKIFYKINKFTDGPILKSPFTVRVVWIPRKKFPTAGGTGYIIALDYGIVYALAIR